MVQQIPFMHGVNFDAVEACPLGVDGSDSEHPDDVPNLLLRQGAAGFVQPPVGNGRRRHGRMVAQIGGDGHPSEARTHLQEDLPAS